MKLIKAYIRTNMIDKVIHALEAGGFADMTVIDLKAIRQGIDPNDLDYSIELAERYMNVAKLEMVLEPCLGILLLIETLNFQFFWGASV